MDLDECQLMAAYADGDAAAFEQLHARHRQNLFRFVENSCGNPALAHELYQDIWMNVIRSRQSYRLEVPFNAWLYRIARNRLVDHYRQQRMVMSDVDVDTQASTLSVLMPGTLTPEEVAIMSQRTELLGTALQSLPEAQREAILLRHIAGMSLSEVASVVDQGMETVKSRLRYGTSRLRSLLQELS